MTTNVCNLMKLWKSWTALEKNNSNFRVTHISYHIITDGLSQTKTQTEGVVIDTSRVRLKLLSKSIPFPYWVSLPRNKGRSTITKYFPMPRKFLFALWVEGDIHIRMASRIIYYLSVSWYGGSNQTVTHLVFVWFISFLYISIFETLFTRFSFKTKRISNCLWHTPLPYIHQTSHTKVVDVGR